MKTEGYCIKCPIQWILKDLTWYNFCLQSFMITYLLDKYSRKNTVFIFRRSASRSGRRSSRWHLTAKTSRWTTRTIPSSRPITTGSCCSGCTGGRRIGPYHGVAPERSSAGDTITEDRSVNKIALRSTLVRGKERCRQATWCKQIKSKILLSSWTVQLI